MTPYLYIVSKMDGTYAVAVTKSMKDEELAICKTLRTAKMVASTMAATGRFHFNR